MFSDFFGQNLYKLRDPEKFRKWVLENSKGQENVFFEDYLSGEPTVKSRSKTWSQWTSLLNSWQVHLRINQIW